MLKKLGKLLKYEFRFYFRIMPPLYLILVLLALPAGYQSRLAGNHQTPLSVIWGAIIVAMMVINLVLIIQRFIDNFLKNPGALMFTLPVTSWTLAASKAIAALCMELMSFLTIIVTALIYARASGVWPVSWGDISFLIYPGRTILMVLFVILMILQQICLIYAAISASHILPRFRFVAGILLYFAIMHFVERPIFKFMELREGFASTYHFPVSSFQMIPYIIIGFVLTAIFFWTTGFLLKHRLNLE